MLQTSCCEQLSIFTHYFSQNDFKLHTYILCSLNSVVLNAIFVEKGLLKCLYLYDHMNVDVTSNKILYVEYIESEALIFELAKQNNCS